ncbi:MAG: hypothetical protein EXX96DRAFT_530474 [Benjaminiella poitrasii]|nr:MAG: hypothetical protein EXX96DRAFT_530474 [Benjaminiella poitrasii]
MEETLPSITSQLNQLIELYSSQHHIPKGNSFFSFINGFILGQLSVLIVVILVLRYLFTEDAKDYKKRYVPSSRLLSKSTNVAKSSPPLLPNDHITSKMYYDVMHHPPESTDWLNVLLAQVILQYREDAKINDRLILSLDEILNGGVKPSFLGTIHVTELNLGEEFPIFSNARIRQASEIGSMRAEIDFEYNDQVTLGIETQLILNWPKPAFAVLPISLILSVVRFSGTLTIELISPPATTTQPEIIERYIAISSYPDFVLDLTFVKVKVPNMWKDNGNNAATATTNDERKESVDLLQPIAAEKIEEFVEDIKEA